MRRRIVATTLMIFGGSALLIAMASIALWSVWLNGQKESMKAVRSASVFVEGSENSVVEDVLTKVMQMKGIESARIVSIEEFHTFLKQHFPDLQEALQDLGADVVPRMLEVVFPSDQNTFARKEIVDAIAAVPNVGRVDDGASRTGKAMSSLRWLGFAGVVLSIGLWIVLFIISLGHYQNIFYSEKQEILLIRSFGATKLDIYLPWLAEAVFQSLLTMVLCVFVLSVGSKSMAEIYNQFFGSLGYEPFQMTMMDFSLISVAVFSLALLAHVMAGTIALFRGRII